MRSLSPPVGAGRDKADAKQPGQAGNALHAYVESQCGCGHWTRAEPGRCAGEEGWTVEFTEWHLVGPGLVSLICAMNLCCSRARIREFLHDWLQLDLFTATVSQCIHEAGRAVEPVVRDEIEEAERALRHWVIARRIDYGTRTEQGSRAFALTIGVIETCRKRGASP